MHKPDASTLINKAPQIGLIFWVTKICATTLGETGGDLLSHTLGFGYLASTFVLLALFAATLAAEMLAKQFSPIRYWAVILSTTMAGTTLSDFLDRSAHLGYLGGAALLICALVGVLLAWRWTLGQISFDHIADPKVEAFYWLTILVSNTLGTALGDFLADNAQLGYLGGSALVGSAILVVILAWRFTKAPHAVLFWAAFVLTRPLGATVGDLLTKARDAGGLGLGTLAASSVLVVVVAGLVFFSTRRRSDQMEERA